MTSVNQKKGILTVNTPIKKRVLVLALASIGAAPLFAYAQTDHSHSTHTPLPNKAAPADKSSMPGMDHSTMQMPGMDHGAMPMKSPSAPKAAMPLGKTDPDSAAPAHDMGAMDHSAMQMQGGSAPADARDPDAYSGGYTRNAGQYSLGAEHRLRMSDEHNFASVSIDRLEYVKARGDEWTAYEGQAWFGGTYNRAVLKAEGEVAQGKLQESRTELLWGHAVSTFWDTQLGVRFDHGQGTPNREWLALGVQGLTPYWFEVDATAYVGPSGRTALRLNAEYDLLLTQKLYLQPSVEATFYGKNDKAREIGRGLSDAKAGLRLKYEVTRQFVPYIGVEWSSKFGKTADYAQEEDESKHETRFVAGISFRF